MALGTLASPNFFLDPNAVHAPVPARAKRLELAPDGADGDSTASK